MILPDPKDAVHKAWLYRLLTKIYDDAALSGTLYFKGGTCAAMLGYLDRFSVDLDFDLIGTQSDVGNTRAHLEKIFSELGLTIKDKSKITPQYFLKYPVKGSQRNTLKLDVTFPHPKANTYEPKQFIDIDRIINCQSIETMFANKLVALIERHEKGGSIAGRDLYDIHHFFMDSRRYEKDVIEERRNQGVREFFMSLEQFVLHNITATIIDQDLNVLLPPEKFQMARKFLKQETLVFLRDEIARLK
jgi:predicted nucleotidyltransferase component of viral defense system